MKDITNINKKDLDNLCQTYIDNVDIPESWLKQAKKHFYKCIRYQRIELMPYCVVEQLKHLGYVSTNNKGTVFFDIQGSKLCRALEDNIRKNRDNK